MLSQGAARGPKQLSEGPGVMLNLTASAGEPRGHSSKKVGGKDFPHKSQQAQQHKPGAMLGSSGLMIGKGGESMVALKGFQQPA